MSRPTRSSHDGEVGGARAGPERRGHEDLAGRRARGYHGRDCCIAQDVEARHRTVELDHRRPGEVTAGDRDRSHARTTAYGREARDVGPCCCGPKREVLGENSAGYAELPAEVQ